jgi:arylsulfatase A
MFSITDSSIDFMDKQVQANKAFYLQISHYAMHEGRDCLPDTREKYQKDKLVQAYTEQNSKKGKEIKFRKDPAVWLGMGNDLDDCIGMVWQKIKELGIEDNTYIIVTSDNGYRHDFNPELTQPLHAAKWWVWQGGLRVPMVVKGPRIDAGTACDENVINYDFLPTFVNWAGGDPSKLKDIDGISLAGLMEGKKARKDFKNRYLYFHYPHYRTSMPHSAIVSGNQKVIHFYEKPDMPMLFDLVADEGEVKNVAKENPKQHQKLYSEMMRYFNEVGARIPKTNPDYNGEVYKKAKEHDIRMMWGPFEGQRSLEEDEK